MESSLAQAYIQRCSSLSISPHPQFLLACQSGLLRCVLTPRDSSDGDKALQVIAEFLTGTTLTELAFAAWPMSAQAWIALCNAMGEHTILEGLAVCGCPLNIEPAAFIQSLGRVKSLRTLSLMQMPEVSAMLEPLVGTSLMRAGSKLNRLVIFQGGVRPNTIRPVLDTLRAAVANSATGVSEIPLDQLDISSNELGQEGGRLLVDTLMRQSPPYPLKALIACSNLLGDDVGAEIVAGCKGIATLKVLNLDDNGLGDATCAAAAQALVDGYRNLEELSLSKISVQKDEHLANLLDAAAMHKSLRALDVAGTPLGPLALHAACQLVKESALITKIRIQVADDAQSDRIASAAAMNSTLTDLDLVGPVSDNAHMTITAMLQNNRRMGTDMSSLAASNIQAFVQSTEQLVYKQMDDEDLVDMQYETMSQASSRLTPSTTNRKAARSALARSASTSSSRDLTKNYTTIAAEVFKRADKDQRGSLTVKEVEQVLMDLGVLEGFSSQEISKIVRNEFRIADSNSAGRLSLFEFSEYYVTMLKRIKEEQRGDKLRSSRGVTYPPGYRRHAELREVFKSFAAFGAGHGVNRKEASKYMDSFRFSKLCKDAKFTEPHGPLPFAMVDVIFARAKPQDSQRMEFRDFLKGLAMIAQEMKRSFEDVVQDLGCEPLALDIAWAAPSRSSSRRSSMASSEGHGSAVLRRPGAGAADNSSIVSGDDVRGPASGAKFFQSFYQSDFGPKKGNSTLAVADLPRDQAGQERLQMYLDHAADLVKPPAPLTGPAPARSLPPSNPSLPKFNSLATSSKSASVVDVVVSGLGSIGPEFEPVGRVMHQLARVVEERLGALEERMASVEHESYLARMKAQEAGARGGSGSPGKSDVEAVAALRSDVSSLQSLVQSMQEKDREAAKSERAGLGASGPRFIKDATARMDRLEETSKEIEKKGASQHASMVKSVRSLEQGVAASNERQQRIEAALVQIAGHVDSLEKSLREERETTTRILDMLASTR